MTQTPHDALFKAVFSEPHHAAAAFCGLLPPAIADALDLEQADLVPGSFVDDSLHDRHTDLLYRVPLRSRTGGDEADPPDVLLYVVFEQQSTVDPLMAFRLLRYMVRIWEAWLADAGPSRSLPPIVPLVLYTGDRPWTPSRRFFDLFDVPDALARAVEPHCPDFRFVLNVLAGRNDEDMPGKGLSRLALLLLRDVRRDNLVDLLARWADDIRWVLDRSPMGLHRIELIVHYILEVSDSVDVETLSQLLAKIDKKAGGVPMSVADRLIAEGLEKGRVEGKAEGRVEGKSEGRKETAGRLLRRLLQFKFGSPPSWVEVQIAQAGTDQLETWAERILSADSLEAVFSPSGQ